MSGDARAIAAVGCHRGLAWPGHLGLPPAEPTPWLCAPSTRDGSAGPAALGRHRRAPTRKGRSPSLYVPRKKTTDQSANSITAGGPRDDDRASDVVTTTRCSRWTTQGRMDLTSGCSPSECHPANTT
ncbi:uncharacterized protein [Zea mays]|uniref:uncharacterized protein n=1 Tax=Zea mays TaxID=4577 RepID=UPI0016530FCC|nr:uncharacterized protein LOC118472980 [Zea mays]